MKRRTGVNRRNLRVLAEASKRSTATERRCERPGQVSIRFDREKERERKRKTEGEDGRHCDVLSGQTGGTSGLSGGDVNTPTYKRAPSFDRTVDILVIPPNPTSRYASRFFNLDFPTLRYRCICCLETIRMLKLIALSSIILAY